MTHRHLQGDRGLEFRKTQIEAKGPDHERSGFTSVGSAKSACDLANRNAGVRNAMVVSNVNLSGGHERFWSLLPLGRWLRNTISKKHSHQTPRCIKGIVVRPYPKHNV